ncbi:MAG: hypothetical protein AAB496_02360 [Patescibacteria group bacterium]
MSTILIKNIQLLDGSGSSPVKADVLIKNDRISAVEEIINFKADDIIDGKGNYLTPGFIDVNNRADRYLSLFKDPSQKHFLLDGVTSIIGGQGGISLAPLIYGSLQTLRAYADVNKINVNWHSVSEFFETLKKQRLGINFGTLIGHTTVRRAVIGEPISRNLTQNELRLLNLILKKNMKSGALGISFDFNNPQTSQASYFEIKKLAQTAAKEGKILSVNLKDRKEGLIESVKKIIFLAKETGVKIIINEFLPFVGFEDNYVHAVELIKKNFANACVYFDIYPSNESFSLLRDFLPEFAKADKRETMLENIRNHEIKKKILKNLPQFDGTKMVVINAPSHNYLEGKTLAEFSQNRNLSVGEGLLKLMEITEFRGEIANQDINFQKLMEVLTEKCALIASNGNILQNQFVFRKFLEIVKKEKILPIEIAIQKITFLPAKLLGLKNRGEIKNDYFADLVIFKEDQILEVILNGQRVVKNGEFQNIKNGKILKRV